jgi:membrane associated rhomboid family serine protease
MFNDLKNDIKNGGTLTILIAIMVCIFVGLNVLPMLLGLGNQTDNFIQNYLAFPASFSRFIYHPWTIITYAFLHASPFHILFNMFALYFFGDVLQSMIGRKHILPVFIWGSILGALLFMLAYNIFPLFKDVLFSANVVGASAGVLAIVIAATTLTPNLPIGFLIWRELELKYVALIFVLIDLISMAGGNAGGHFAHLGGALMGYIYIKQLQNGFDFGKWFQIDFSKMKNKKKFQVYRNDEKPIAPKKNTEAELNRILEKISASSYESLTKAEKDFLKQYGNK